MQNVLIVIHLLIVIALVGVVLLQRSEGGGLGMGSGGGGGVGGFMTGRGQANALTRATAILAGLFFITSLVLAVMATQGRTQRSIIDGAPAPAGTTAPVAPTGPSAPNAGGVLDQLRQMQNQGGSQPPQPGTPTR
ncbi:preprotein translocase subunit SecG [Boseaceae bacterium BT-24-1]|nr:preprotein translocase subunit SecG [Boseaceae bacterium BT-24-1]